MRYWLFKSEPDCFSFADLCAGPGRATGWDGVRNFQARNFLRDDIRVGDGILYYHSGTNPPAIAGLAEVVEAGHPDPTAFDPSADHHDPRSRPESPTWYQVKIRAIRPIDPPLGLPDLRRVAALAGMELLRKGSRLSIQPVTPDEWAAVLDLAGIPASSNIKGRRIMSRIEHAAIFAEDPSSLKDFYVQAFGLRVALDNGRGSPPGYFLGDDHGTFLEIIGRPEGVEKVNQRYVSHVAFTVEDVAAKRADLEGLGLVFEVETAVDNDSMTTAFCNDPAGNRIQVVRRKKPLGH